MTVDELFEQCKPDGRYGVMLYNWESAFIIIIDHMFRLGMARLEIFNYVFSKLYECRFDYNGGNDQVSYIGKLTDFIKKYVDEKDEERRVFVLEHSVIQEDEDFIV